MNNLVSTEVIASRIYFVRGKKVILDSDLAELYGVPTKRLNEQVRRNIERFPGDFMFRLTKEEYDHLRSQIATSSDGSGHGGRRTLPLVFTEHGAIMAATVLNSKQAVEVSIFVVRAFVRLREMLVGHKQFAHRLDELEKRLAYHDENFQIVFDAIKQLLAEDEKPKRRIGF
ncbi:MAG: ORF6N domain-containing protein [Desulfobulbales bacterium]|nr:ORF6N domain-containing protein [Desulfobulbales bacterium]